MYHETQQKEEGDEAAIGHLDIAKQLYEHMTPRIQAFLNFKDLDMGINSHGNNNYKNISLHMGLMQCSEI